MLSSVLFALLASAWPAFAALDLFPTGADYPFAIHLPIASTSTPPPAVLFLHGSGSRGGVETLDKQTTWDGVGWLVAQYEGGNRTGAQHIVAEQYLAILPLLPADSDEWNSTSVVSVLNATAALATVNSSFAFDASRGSFAVWNTALALKYPTPFAALVPCAGTATYSDSQLTALVSPPSGSSPISILGFASPDDEKQPAAGTEETLAALQGAAPAGASGNWTAHVVSGRDHEAMSQEAWMDEELWAWIGEQKQLAGEETAVQTAVQDVSATASSLLPSSASDGLARASTASGLAIASRATGSVGAASGSAVGAQETGQTSGARKLRPFSLFHR